MSLPAKEQTTAWLDNFKKKLETLKNGPQTPFVELQKEVVIAQIEDLEEQLRNEK